MQETENTAALLGRVAMSLIFIHGGWGKLLAPVATQAMLAGHHLPMVQLGWILAVVVELGGGPAILIGLFTRPVGLVLAIWCVVTALIGHANFADRNQEIHFCKNMAMMGGFLYVAAFGARAWSLVAPRRRASSRLNSNPEQGAGRRRAQSLVRMRHCAAHLRRRLVLAQTFVNHLPQQIVVGPGEIFDFGDQLGPHPMHTA
jgi:putative oxidoreductase